MEEFFKILLDSFSEHSRIVSTQESTESYADFDLNLCRKQIERYWLTVETFFLVPLGLC